MIDFDVKVQSVLSEYHERLKAETARMNSLAFEEGVRRRDEFLLPVGPDVGRFLNTLLRGAESKCILEIGTSYGYSTVWLAEAARKNGGRLITLEIDGKKAKYAKSQIEKAGLEAFVEFRVGDALTAIRDASERFDFVLLDLWKDLYVPCFQLFLPKLNADAFVVADNMILPSNHHQAATSYRMAVRKSGMFDSLLLPIGSGIEVSQKIT